MRRFVFFLAFSFVLSFPVYADFAIIGEPVEDNSISSTELIEEINPPFQSDSVDPPDQVDPPVVVDPPVQEEAEKETSCVESDPVEVVPVEDLPLLLDLASPSADVAPTIEIPPTDFTELMEFQLGVERRIEACTMVGLGIFLAFTMGREMFGR